jgi:hypothetical protein
VALARQRPPFIIRSEHDRQRRTLPIYSPLLGSGVSTSQHWIAAGSLRRLSIADASWRASQPDEGLSPAPLSLTPRQAALLFSREPQRLTDMSLIVPALAWHPPTRPQKR